jgi:CheY-like chemotaxis protein
VGVDEAAAAAAPSGEPLPLLFEVCDTGPGISAEAQARLFQPFEQAHAGPSGGKWGGSGLGLSICKVMGELLGGSVGATSAPGAGSTFWLRLRADWWADEAGGGASGTGGTGTDSGDAADTFDDVRAGGAPGTLMAAACRQRRVSRMSSTGGAGPAALAAARPEEARRSEAAVWPRRHSLDGWRRELGAQAELQQAGPPVATHARRRASTDGFFSAPPAAGSLAASMAAVAGAHINAGSDGGANGSGGAAAAATSGAAAAAVSSALLHAMRILREAVDDAEVAVAWRLGDPSEWQPPPRLSRDSARGSRDSGSSALPAPTPASPPPLRLTATAPPPSAPSWPGPLKSVLLVDDEPVNTALVARRLKREAPDVAVTIADDGAEMVALTCQQRRRYDVVLMDQHMRGMNGDTAVAALRAHEASASLPRALVLACTGNACAPDLQRFAAAGFDGVITKPLDMGALVPTLSALMRSASGGVAAAPCEHVQMFPPPLSDTA